jgi:hypothetical protein
VEAREWVGRAGDGVDDNDDSKDDYVLIALIQFETLPTRETPTESEKGNPRDPQS